MSNFIGTVFYDINFCESPFILNNCITNNYYSQL